VKPLFASEKLLAGPPYRGCGISSDWHGTWLATDGESGINAIGRQKGQGGRRSDLQRGWTAFATQKPADSNGWVDMGDIPLIHDAMFGPGMPQPAGMHATPWRVWELIGDHAVSMAIHTGAVGSADAVRRYVNAVPHQVVAWKKRTINSTRYVKIIDPMHGPSETYTGHWVKWTSLKKCALAIKDANGSIYAFRYPIGGWTQEARTKLRLKAKHAADIDSLKAQHAEAVAAMDEQLTECREDGTDAAHLDAYDRAIESIEALKADVGE